MSAEQFPLIAPADALPMQPTAQIAQENTAQVSACRKRGSSLRPGLSLGYNRPTSIYSHDGDETNSLRDRGRGNGACPLSLSVSWSFAMLTHFLRLKYLVAMSTAIAVCHEAAAEPPSPAALLRGVESVRTESDSFRVKLEISYISPSPEVDITCLIEMDGRQRRSDVSGEVPSQVIIRDGDEFYGFCREPHEDVEIYDLDRAVGVRGDLIFDPRILGLSDLMPCSLTVQECLWSKKVDLQLVGRESLRGVELWKVRATRGDAISEYWIEEPSFRVHRTAIALASG